MPAWPSIPMLLFTDTTTWQSVIWGKDAGNARQLTFGVMGRPINCLVDETSAEMTGDHARSNLVTHLFVTFRDKDWPGLKIRDQGIWVEGNETITVVGVHKAGDARGRIWIATCEKRPLL